MRRGAQTWTMRRRSMDSGPWRRSCGPRPYFLCNCRNEPELHYNVAPLMNTGTSTAIRAILAEHARLSVPVDQLKDEGDLYDAGLTSLTTVNLMLALEEHFDVEFTDKMLGRKTFGTIRSLVEAIQELRGG